MDVRLHFHSKGILDTWVSAENPKDCFGMEHVSLGHNVIPSSSKDGVGVISGVEASVVLDLLKHRDILLSVLGSPSVLPDLFWPWVLTILGLFVPV
jgi:hypothetical protein